MAAPYGSVAGDPDSGIGPRNGGNDNCADAVPLMNGVTAFSTLDATTDGPALPDECEEGFGLALVNEIWYDYTASCTGTAMVSTCNDPSYDTRLAAYFGAACFGDLAECNDDATNGACGLTSETFIDVITGEVYKLRVGGLSGSGTGNLTISCD